MDSVPTVFRQRVAELWNCCEFFFVRCQCDDSFPLASVRKKTDIAFYMSLFDGVWRYGFTNPDLKVGKNRLRGYKEMVMKDNVIDLEKCRKITLTMDELLKRPDLHDLKIAEIVIRHKSNLYWKKPMLKKLDVGMQKLLNCVCFLSNKPELHITSWKYFADADSEVLKQWIEKWQFSLLAIHEYTSADNQLVEQKFFSRRNCFLFSRMSFLRVFSVTEGHGFLTEHVKSGRLTHFQSVRQNWVFPFAFMAHFIYDFMENAEDWSNKEKLFIDVVFDKMTRRRLKGLCKRGVCDFRDEAYLFSKSNVTLTIKQYSDRRYTIYLLH